MPYNPMFELSALGAKFFVEKDSISKTLEKEPYLSCKGCTYEDDCQLNEKIKYCPYCGRPLNGTAEKKRVFSKEKFIEDMGYEYYSATPSIPNWVVICDGKEIYIDSNGGRKIQMGEIKDELWDYSSLEHWEDEV